MKLFCGIIGGLLLFILLIIVFLFSFSRRNVDDIKAHAESRIVEFNYEIVAYEGYKHSVIPGGDVWYMVRKKNDPLNYSLFFRKWDNEYHMYGLFPDENVHIRDKSNSVDK